jgi:hypothetical protein
VNERQRGFGSAHAAWHWLASIAIDCAEEIEWGSIGSDFDFIGRWFKRA